MKSAKRRHQILECAKRVFAQRGYHGTSISHVCDEAEIARGTLYQYFENKKGLFMAILEDVLERIDEMMIAQRPGMFPAPEFVPLQTIVEWNTMRLKDALGVVFRDGDTIRILLREAVGLDFEVETLMTKIENRLLDTIEQDILAAQQAGFLRELEARATAILMLGGAEKLAFTFIREKKRVDLEYLAREVSLFQLFGVLSTRVKLSE